MNRGRTLILAAAVLLGAFPGISARAEESMAEALTSGLPDTEVADSLPEEELQSPFPGEGAEALEGSQAHEPTDEITSAVQVITGFAGLSAEEGRRFYSAGDKPSLEELFGTFPQTLDIFTAEDGITGGSVLDVTWECAGDYENSSLYYYVFLPVWDEEDYVLDTPLDAIRDVPYIEIILFPEADGGSAELPGVSASDNETYIFNFLLSEMKLNSAAACGVLANLQCESGFRPDIIEYGYTWETGGGYGLCQWTNFPRLNPQGRRTDLVNYCSDHGYDYKTLEGQLHYLYYELNLPGYRTVLLDYLRSVPNTAEGAYMAGYRWCYYFEEPYNYKTVAVTRGNLARNDYWPRWKTGVEGSAPEGVVDVIRTEGPGEIYVAGWAFDRDQLSASLTIRVSIGGTEKSGYAEIHEIRANGTREDVDQAYPGVGKAHGYTALIETRKTGKQSVYVYAEDVGSGLGTKLLGSGSVTINKDSRTPSMAGVFNSVNGGDIRWSKVEGATGYRVYRKRSGEGTKLVAEVKGEDTLQCYDPEIKDGCWGRVYHYYVRALFGSSAGPESDLAVLQRIAPMKVTGKSSPKMGTINLKWDCTEKENKAYGYEIQYALSKADLYARTGSFSRVTISGRKNLKTSLTGLSSGRSWYFRVRSYVEYTHSVTGQVTRTWSQYSKAESITVR